MSESIGEPVAEQMHTVQRVAELEIEVGRLVAELDEVSGGDPVMGVSRLLSLAASTIDVAIGDVRDEAQAAVRRAEAEIQQQQIEAEQDTVTARANADVTRAAAEQVTVEAQRELEEARASAVAVAENAAAAAEEIHRSAESKAAQLMAVARHEVSLAIDAERQRFQIECLSCSHQCLAAVGVGSLVDSPLKFISKPVQCLRLPDPFTRLDQVAYVLVFVHEKAGKIGDLHGGWGIELREDVPYGRVNPFE